MKVVLITILFCCLATVLFSQTLSFNQKEFLSISSKGNGNKKQTFDNQYADVSTGSAYYNEAWLPGQALMLSGKVFAGLSLKVDLYKSKIFIDNHDTVYEITDVPQLSQVILFPSPDTSQKAIFAVHPAYQGINSPVVQLLSNGKVTLVKQDSRDLRETQTGVNTPKEKVFSSKVRYFIVKDNAAIEVKVNKKALEKMFTPEDWIQVQKIANDNHLSLNNESDISKVFRSYNAL